MYIRNNWSLTPIKLRIGLLLLAFFISSVSFAAEPVCAVVKIEIQQELTLERQAFDAVMRINNGLDLLSLENVNINVTFKDAAGSAVVASSDPNSPDAKFFIKIDSMTGITDVSGFGTVAPKSTAEVHWLIIPAPKSGGDTPSGKLYFIGATLSYNLGGELQTTTVTPDSIYVKPLPLLSLDYFLEKDVFADDAFTEEKEPPVPFTLGVRVKNNGAASTTGLKIDSAQPAIIDNDQGLLIAFNIIGSNVNELPTTNSLLIDFGEIKPNEASMGRWDMVTTLSGRFTEFTANFSHADELGGNLTSIIDPVINTHTLIRNVRVDVAGRDLVRDFLALDGTVYRVYESSGVDTDVTDVSVSSTLTPVSTGAEVSLNFTMPITPGFSYAKRPDPYAGTKVVKQMFRSDGKAIPLDNVWTSKTRNLSTNPPSWDYWFNVFDANTSGTYALIMGPADIGPVAPVFTPMGNVTTYETATVTFPVSATDANVDAVILTAATLPTGATFTSDTSGKGTFTWTPSVGQAGNYTITFTASDGTLSNQATVNIKVNPVDDTDGDGLNDAWEIANFGDLSRDGTGDLDGDGISDLQEYLNNSDPNLVSPLAPINLVALPGNTENTLSWDTVTEIDSYNIYWSLTADVSPTTGTLVNVLSSPHVHTGLDNDVTYYYIVTSVGTGGESAPSNVASVTTGVRDWAAPVNLQSNSGSTFTLQNGQIAMSATGEAIAVWQQTDNSLNSIWSSRYIPATGWTTPVVISDITVDASSAKVAVDSEGNALVVWQQINPAQTDVVAAHFDVVNSVWESAVALETDDTNAALNPQIVISKTGTNSGNALVVWQQGASIMSSRFVAQAWQTAAVVSNESVIDLSQLTLSMNENGDAFAAWAMTSDQTNYDLRVNKFSNNTWATTVVTLATGLDNWLQPALDINASGNAVMAWPAFNSTRHVMMTSQYDVSTGWGVADAIEANLGDAKSAQVAMDTNGNAFVAWAQSGSPYSIYVNRLDASLGFAATATLIETHERGDAVNPQLVIDNRGNAIVSWQHSDGVQQNILAAVYNNTDSTWGVERVIETTNTGDAISPAMAVSDSGDAIVLWQQNNNGELTIAANHFAVGNSGIPNINPIAVAGADQSVDEQTAVTLDGSSSFDQDGSGLVASYNWTQTAGTTVTLTGETTATLSFTAPTLVTAEVLTFELTVMDDASATSTATVSITINPVNAAPTVNAGIEQNVNEQTTVTLSGTGSDTDGTIDSYSWTQISGTAVTLNTANTATATFNAPIVTVQQGVQSLVFELTVTDNEGAAATLQVNVLVSPVNATPVANAGLDQNVDEQSVVSLTGNASDADGVIATYVWTQVSGLPVALTDNTTANASFTTPTVLVQDGVQTIVLRLTVTDNEGATFSDDVSVVVNAVNSLPIATAGLPQSVDEQTTVSLQATSFDSDGSVVSHQWTQTAGTTVTITNAASTTASFVAPAVLVQDGAQTFSFTLTVTDNEGAVVTSTPVTITVNPVNAIPTVNAGLDVAVDEQSIVNLTAAANDSDGSITSYSWTQISGVPVTLTGNTTANASFTTPIVLVQDGPQTLIFSVVATDNETASVTDEVVITVNPVNASPVANAGLDQNVVEQTAVSLVGSGSDTDGSVSTYQWTQTSGLPVTLTSANTDTATFTTPIVLVQDGAQTLSFSLTVTDNENTTHVDVMNVVVNPVNTTPTANAGLEQNVDEQTAVTLTGSGADTDGSITAYQWTQTGGAVVTLSGATTVNASFTAPTVLVQDGVQTLTFRLTVTDNETATVFDDMNVVVNPVNANPTANAGVDQNVDEQTAVTLTGSGADTDGSITAYQWTQTGGAVVTLSGATTVNASFTAPTVLVQDGVQTLTFRLTVTDNETATVFDDMNVVVNPVNANPTANAGVDQNVDEQTVVTLTGSGADTDGSITAYQWTQTGGATVTIAGSTTANASFTTPTVLLQDGAQTLTFRLNVTDNETATVFDDINVVVNPVNAKPTANAGIDQTVNEQTAVTLAGSGADTDGSITAYQWTQTTGLPVTLINANTAMATFTTPIVLVQDGAQTLTFRLTVTDNETVTVFDDVNIIVNPVNTNPIANAGPNRAINEQTPVTLTGAGNDVDGSITAYQWTQIAGPVVTLTNANTATPNFTTPVVLVVDSPTVLTFRLTVTDNETAIATSDVNIGVIAVNASPVTSAGIDLDVNEQTVVLITATATDSDGSIAAYQWTQVSGLPVTLAAANTATATFTTPIVLIQDGAQVLTFRNSVTDNEGATHSDEMTVTVQPVNALPAANAGLDQRIAEYSTVTLSGSGTDSDGSIAAYQWTQVSGLPVVITNNNTATASFVAPPVYQDEVLSFNLMVTDNESGVSVADNVNITLFSVNPDDDADGLPDLYEIATFGDLTRDGTADFDNDGYSDLLEYQQGTNPLVLTLAAPIGLKAVAANTQVTLTWDTVTDAVGYNVYWDTVPNVTKDSNVINNVSSGYVHTGLTNGSTYYYVITTLSSGDESVVSDEVNAIPGKRAWQSAKIVDSGTINYYYPQIAMNRNGQSVVVFEQFDGIAYSTFANISNKDTGWGTAQAIETGDAGHVYNPQVAIDDNGNAVAVWEQFNGTSYNVWANVYDAQNASWGIAEQIESSLTGGSEYFMPQVAMGKSGSAVVTWQKRDGFAISIWANHFDMSTGWTQAEKLETNDLYSAYLPQVDVDSTGNAAVVWEQYDTVTAAYSTWATHYNTATGWSTAAVISNVGNISAYDAQVALSDNGKTVAVWEQFDGARFNVWSNVAQNGVWGIAERVEYNSTGASEYYLPQVAIDKSGTATVVWQQFDGSQLSAWANRYTNGVWEVASQIEANGITPITNPKVAMDEDGNAVAVWEQYDETGNGSLISIWANRYTQDSGWASATPIETNDSESMWLPEVAMDAYGNAKAAWFHLGVTEDNILVAENILDTNPPVANAGIDQAGFAARDIVTLDASASSDTNGTITSYHWQQLSGVEVSLNGKNTIAPTFIAPRSRDVLMLAFMLTVTDNEGLSHSDTVVITIGDAMVASLVSSLFSTSSSSNSSVNLPEQRSIRQSGKATDTKGKPKLSTKLRSQAVEIQSVQISNTIDGQGGRGRPAKPKK